MDESREVGAVEVFVHEKGKWNITSALELARAGRFGDPIELDTAPAIAAVNPCDPDKLAAISNRPDVMATPLLVLEIDNGFLLIDGHHRLHALHKAGRRTFKAWIIPERLEKSIRIPDI